MGHLLATLPEWPSLCSDYHRNFGFGLFEPGRLPDLTAFKDSGPERKEEKGGAQIGK